LVEVAFHGGDEPDPDLPEGLERVRALGGRRPVLVSATLAPAPAPGADAVPPGPGSPSETAHSAAAVPDARPPWVGPP
ncbi:hypothetical protein K4H00_26855, partial [Mycobacterium tuberculosis]|nr:hypothetical protein [Mycobacterium tuberculosis]